jgi:hypothetical protein
MGGGGTSHEGPCDAILSTLLLRPPSLLHPNNPIIPLSNILIACSTPDVTGQVSHPQSTTGGRTALRVLMFVFTDTHRKDQRLNGRRHSHTERGHAKKQSFWFHIHKN